MMETDQEDNKVVDKHLYIISGYKDQMRHEVLMRSFKDIMFTKFVAFSNMVKVFGN